MITKSEGFGNCGNKIHTDFGANAFDKVNLRGNYRIASLDYNTLTNELTINQYPDVSKTVVLGESSVSRNTTTSHKDAISGILEWANMSIDDFNNLDKTKNYVVYNANNPESDRYLYYTYDKGLGEWSSSSLTEGDEFFNIEDSIKYRYENNKIVNAIDVTLTARNTVIDGKSTGITLEVSPTTGDGVHLDLVNNQYAGLMSPEDKTKLDNVESSIGAVLELGNPFNGRVPLYLKTKDGEILSTVNLDEDDYIDSIVASIATQDDPDNGIKAGDKILTFTLTNGNKIVTSLEGWFVYYTGLKTDAIDTVVVENKIKSTLLLNPDSDNLSEISSSGLLTKLLWQSEDKSVKFIKGLKSSYDSILYSGYVYFTTDTKEVIVNGQAYGVDLKASDLNLVEKLEEDANVPGRIKVTKSNGGVYYINIPDVTTTSNGLMLSEDKAKLDSIEDSAQVNVLEGIKINNITQSIENKVATLNVYDKSQVNSLVANGIKYKGESTSIGNLPTSKEVGDSYRITVEKLGLAMGAVVFWDGDKWSTFTGNLDLSGYATKQDLEDASGGSTAEFDKKLEGKVDKVTGSSLVSDAEIDKLSYIDTYVRLVDSSIIEGKINLDVTTRVSSDKGAETVEHIVLQEASSTNNGLMSSKHYDVIEALNLNDNYLDKTGTPSATWQLSKNAGPKIKNSGGQFELRNANDDTYADLIVKDLTITGNVTQEGSSFITEAETVEVTDNTILLNKGEVGAGVTKGHAGIEIDRGTLPMYKIYFDESDDRFKAGQGDDLWPIMLRNDESELNDSMFLSWDSSTKRAKTTNAVPIGTHIELKNGNIGGSAFIGASPHYAGGLVIRAGNSSAGYPAVIQPTSNGLDIIPYSLKRIHTQSDIYANNFYRKDGTAKVVFSDDLATELNKYLPLTGGTMAGNIVLPMSESENNLIGIQGKPGWIPEPGAFRNNILSYTAEGVVLGNDKVGMGIISNNLMMNIAGSITARVTGPIEMSVLSDAVIHSPSLIALSGEKLILDGSNGVEDDNGNKFWTAGNDGAESGLDADMLDGKHAADFAAAVAGGYLPLSGGTLTGNLIITNKVDSSYNPVGIKSNNGNNIISRDGGSLVIGDANNASVYIQSSSSAHLYVTKGSQSYEVWHEGNDGDNSGLDADLLDGKQGSEYALKSEIGGAEPVVLVFGVDIVLEDGVNGTMTDEAYTKAFDAISENRSVVLTMTQGDVVSNAFFNISGIMESDGAVIGIQLHAGQNVTDGNSVELAAMSFYVTATLDSTGSHQLVYNSNAVSLLTNGGGNRFLTDRGTYSTINLTNIDSNIGLSNGNKIILTYSPTTFPPTGMYLSKDGNQYGMMVALADTVNIGDASLGLAFMSRNEPTINGKKIATIDKVVTLDDAQTIVGAKTFTAAVTGINGFYDTSDIRLKSNIKPIELKPAKINLYEFDKNGKHSFGVIAQEIEKSYPSTVIKNEDGYNMVNYNEILTIKCAELEAENKELRSRLDKLEQLLVEKGVLQWQQKNKDV